MIEIYKEMVENFTHISIPKENLLSYSIESISPNSYPKINIECINPLFETDIIVDKKNKKEGNNMEEILKIYKENKIIKLRKEQDKLFEEIRENSELGKIAQKLKKQAEKELEKNIPNYKKEMIYIGFGNTEDMIKKEDELNSQFNEKRDEIEKELEEIKALISETTTYEQKIDILKAYNVLDKNGKLVK